jgi:hypothetical protein
MLVGTGGGAGQGNSVALSTDGNTAIVGGPYDIPTGHAQAGPVRQFNPRLNRIGPETLWSPRFERDNCERHGNDGGLRIDPGALAARQGTANMRAGPEIFN